MRRLGGTLKGLIWPAGAPMIAVWAYLKGNLGYPLAQWWPGLILITLALVALVGLRFGRGRVIAAAALIYFSLDDIRTIKPGHVEWVFIFVGLSLLALAHLKDHRLFRWRALPLWFLGAWGASFPFWPDQWNHILTKLMIAPPWFHSPSIEPLGEIATSFAFLIGLGLFLRLVNSGEAIESGLFGAFTALWVSILQQQGSEAAHLCQLAGAVALFLSLIERSHALAYRDQLTGLPGRRALEESLGSLGHRYTLAMVDVDRFKKFNDKYGHDAGDEVLRMVASRLKGLKGGRAYRYGGEEFTLVFPGRNLDDVRDKLESIRLNICKKPFTLRAEDRPKKKPSKPKKGGGRGQVKVSVSIGAAQAADRSQKPSEVLKTADECLYRAKQNGRNRVIAA